MTNTATPLEYGMLIDGTWKRSGDGQLEIWFPFDLSLVGMVPIASRDDVEAAAGSALDTHLRRKPLSPPDRFEILNRVAGQMAGIREELARSLVLEVGKTIREARAEVISAIDAMRCAAEEAKRIHGETLPADAVRGSENRVALTMRFPGGPTCAITPFNAPLNQATHKIASALAAGNPVVIKPSEETPLTTARLAQLFVEAELPAGWLQVVYGPGETVGEWLLQDTRFRRYTFTGSAAVGRHIRSVVGLRPSTMELGSNAPTIVHGDADLEMAADACMRSGYAIAGQVCTSVQRLYVQKSVLERFLDVFAGKVSGLQLGNPLNGDTDVGPMRSDEAAARAEEIVQEAVKAGASLVLGGKRDGRLFSPTILLNPPRTVRAVCEEIFSPIVSVIPYDTIDEAIEWANDSPYGLQAGVFTRSLEVAFTAMRQLQVGGLMINDTSRYRAAHLPYGGVKESGVGREGPRYAIEEMTDLKLVVLNL